MSFFRHEEIYRTDAGGTAEEAAVPSAHRIDEFPTGYSWAGCSPAEPACASPASFSVGGPVLRDNRFSANGIVSLSALSQYRGPDQLRLSHVPHVPHALAISRALQLDPAAERRRCSGSRCRWCRRFSTLCP